MFWVVQEPRLPCRVNRLIEYQKNNINGVLVAPVNRDRRYVVVVVITEV